MPTATSRRVYVGNIAWRVSWQDLKDHFRAVGEPTYAEVFYDYDGRSKGCGVIEFSSLAEAEEAINKMTDTKLKGRPIFVREDREPRSFSFQQRYKGYDDYYYGKGGYGGYDDYGYNRKGGYDSYYDDYYYGKGDSWGGKGGKGKGGKGKGYDSGKGYGKGAGKSGKGYGKGGYGRDDDYGKGGKGKGKGEDKRAGKGEGKGRGGKAEGEKSSSDKLGRQVFVGNLSWDTTKEDLTDYFAKAGDVVKAEINSYRNGRSRGNGIVLFKTAKEAQKAITDLNATQLQGREIFVKEDKYPE